MAVVPIENIQTLFSMSLSISKDSSIRRTADFGDDLSQLSIEEESMKRS